MKGKLAFPILIFILLFSPQSNAQWTSSAGLDGMEVYDIEVFDSTIYLSGGPRGVYSKSLNNGSWNILNVSPGIYDIESTDSVLFAIAYNSAVSLFRSFDSGITWEELDLFTYFALEHLSTIKNNIIVSTYDSLLLSSDNGESWVNIVTELPFIESNYSLAFDTVLFYGGGLIDTIFRSDNLGQSWTPITRLGLPSYYGKRLNSIVEFNDSLWAATRKGVYVFGGDDVGWLSRNAGIFIQKITDLLVFNDTLFCSTKTGIYYLDQNTWVNESQGLETRDVNCMEADNAIRYAGTGSGPFQKQGEEDWQPDYEGLNHLNVFSVSVFLPDVFALTTKGLFKSQDNGESFEKMGSDKFTKCYHLIATDSLFYLRSDSGLLVSRDYGQSWEPKKQGFDSNSKPSTMAISPEFFFAGTTKGLYRAEHSNLVWEKVPGILDNSRIMSIGAIDSIVVLSPSSDYLTFTSVDHGTHFDTSINYYGNLVTKNKKFYGLHYYDRLITSQDGFDWKEHPYPEGDWSCVGIDATKEDIVIAGSKLWISYYDIFVLVSHDKGNSWNEVSYNLPVPVWPQMNHVAIMDNRVFTSPTSQGLWYRDDLLVGETELTKVESKEVLLYPNPVKSLLTIDVGNSFNGPVHLKIYDINGRIVKQQNLPALKSSFELSDLKPGIYFLQFVGEGKTITQKIIKY